MSIGHRRFPESQGPDADMVLSVMERLDKASRLHELTQHEGWEVLNEELTRKELAAMQNLASGPTDPDSIQFNRATAQICRYLRDLPSRTEQERDTLQADIDLMAPRGVGNGR